MTYSSRRPAIVAPKKTWVPNVAAAGIAGQWPTTGYANDPVLTNYRAYLLPFSAPADTGVVSLSVMCESVSGVSPAYDIGLYSESFTRLGSLGSTSLTGSAGERTWTPATPISVAAWTTYFAAVVVLNGTWTAVNTSNYTAPYFVLGIQYYDLAATTTLPSTITGSTGALTIATQVPYIKIVFSG